MVDIHAKDETKAKLQPTGLDLRMHVAKVEQQLTQLQWAQRNAAEDLEELQAESMRLEVERGLLEQQQQAQAAAAELARVQAVSCSLEAAVETPCSQFTGGFQRLGAPRCLNHHRSWQCASELEAEQRRAEARVAELETARARAAAGHAEMVERMRTTAERLR
jgi:hypothetical protein